MMSEGERRFGGEGRRVVRGREGGVREETRRAEKRSSSGFNQLET